MSPKLFLLLPWLGFSKKSLHTAIPENFGLHCLPELVVFAESIDVLLGVWAVGLACVKSNNIEIGHLWRKPVSPTPNWTIASHAQILSREMMNFYSTKAISA
jgi:hypothetical protein